jgi:presequence protease
MTNYHGFELVRETGIGELRTHARLFKHIKTGAQLLSLENEDENKVFGINFRTPPTDSTGLPHILEHAVLCGSQRFPVREPFVELVKGSLKTFVNAFTFPDKTGYPVASQNVQDFYNLIDVYMDAVLYPLVTPQTLQQEGWHYELDSLEGELNFKGVVFNEMKGAYSSPDGVMGRYSQQLLFPDHIYGLDAGGDPTVIPDLTYEQFKQFHETYYHPSNAYIFFCGDDEPEERLRRMDAYLKDFEAKPVDAAIPLAERFKQPQRFTRPYDVGSEPAGSTQDGKKHMLTVSWLLEEMKDPERSLALSLLAHILIGTPASPLRKALIESGLGEDLAGVGLETDLREPFFSTGLKGVAKEDVDKVETLIFETLSALVEHGIDPGTVAASLNTIEFRLRENNTGSFPRGLLLMFRALHTWLYGGDPLAPLAFERPMESIKQRVRSGSTQENEGRYFESLIQQYMLDNPHRLTLVLEPDAELNQRLETEERARLDKVRASLNPEQLARLVEDTRLLKLRQETPDSPEALATIPVLTLEDLDPQVRTIPVEESRIAGVRTLYHDLFTNGIIYLDLGLNLKQLPQELIPYVSLFGRALVEMGTEKEDFVRLSQRIGSQTGGIRATSFTTSVRGSDLAETWLFVRGKALTAQFGDLAAILRDILLTLRLDNRDRFRQMVLEEKASLESMLVPAGHQVVNSRLRARYNTADWVSEKMGGFSYLFFIRELAEAVERDWQGVLAQLETVRSLLVNRSGMLANITLDGESWKESRPTFEMLLNALPENGPGEQTWVADSLPPFEGFSIPAQVNYVGKGGNLYELGYPLDGSMLVIRNYLRTTWLWEKVRVQGGAYGGFCLFDLRSGVFAYISYRDPNLLSTLDVYDKTGDFLKKLDLSQEELTKTIIGAIGEMDAYLLPDAKGFVSMSRILAKETDEERQRLREQVLSTKVKDFRTLAGYLDGLKENGSVVVLGSADALKAANAGEEPYLPGWLEIKKVL